MTATTTETLSTDQLLILTSAAQRLNRMALPLPAGLRARGTAKRALLASLLEAGLLEERSAEGKTSSSRQDGQRQHHALLITAAGRAAVGKPDRPEGAEASGARSALQSRPAPAGMPNMKRVAVRAARPEAAVDAAPAPDVAELAAAAPPAATRPRGKLGRVLDAVMAEGGATLAELAALTGWQPHTTRAALTGLRRRGFALFLCGAKNTSSRKAYHLRSEVSP